MISRFSTLLFLVSISTISINAQSQRGDLIRIMVSPSNADMNYDIGEVVTFDVAVYKFGQLVKGAEVDIEIGPEKMEPEIQRSLTLTEGHAAVKGGSMSVPGFLRCRVQYEEGGKTYSNTGTAGVAPLQILPTTTLPDDFTTFWDAGKAALEEIPLASEITLMPEYCTVHTNVYHVRFDNVSGHIYGILGVPKAPGKYPAVLSVPGAGVRAYHGGFFDENVVSLQIGIHGVPVNFYDSDLYLDLRNGALSGYWRSNLDDKDQYYYKRVYLGCVRAVDFIYSLPEFDGENIGVQGGSQGGALSIVTAGLDNRIDYLVSYFPALCDLTGYLHGRAGGWPHLFDDEFTKKEEKIETSKYYDVVNFARQVQSPGYYSFGYNDNVCPPTSIYSAYNVVPAPKQTVLFNDAAHWRYSEQTDAGNQWLLEQLGVR